MNVAPSIAENGGSNVFSALMPGVSADSIRSPGSASSSRRATISISGSSGTTKTLPWRVMDSWVQTAAAEIGRRAPRELEALVGVSSPSGDETPTSASSSRAARRPISAAAVCTQESMTRHGNVFVVPELPEMEIVARRLDEALPGERIESALTPGINALKTFDPPFSAIDGATFTGARRRGKLLLLDVDTLARGALVLLLHLMSAGRAQLFDKRASLRDKTSRVLFRLSSDRELSVREFGTEQRAWVKLLTPDAVDADESLDHLALEAWPDPPDDLAERSWARPAALAPARPARDRRIGRTWVDEILHAAQLSPFKRGDDLSDAESRRSAKRWSPSSAA